MQTKVLFLPHSRRAAYFLEFFEHTRSTADWHIGMVAPEDNRSTYAPLEIADADYFVLPYLGREAKNLTHPSPELRSLIEECERVTGLALNRLIMPEERTIGRAYGLRAYTWHGSATQRQALADNEYPRRVAMTAFDVMHRILSQFQPDLILCGACPPVHHFATWMLAQRAKIPFVMGRFSKVHSNRCFWTLDREMLNSSVWDTYRELEDAQAPVSEAASHYLKEFREKPQTVGYIQENWRRAANLGRIRIHLNQVRLAINKLGYLLKGAQGAPPKPIFSRMGVYYLSGWLSRRQQRFYQTFDDSALREMRYLYVPLHKEPELAINFQAPFWHNQLQTVAYLSTLLPSNTSLLVREHKFNMGRRPNEYYKQLSKLPNVRIIHPYDPQFKYIQHADLIVTDNGSTGWEGLMLGRQVITLARTFYEPPGLAVRITDPEQLASEVMRQLTDPPRIDSAERDRKLGWLLDAEMRCTVSDHDEGHLASLGCIDALTGASADR